MTQSWSWGNQIEVKKNHEVETCDDLMHIFIFVIFRLKKTSAFIYGFPNPFHITSFFLYPMRISEKLWLPDIFMG